MALLVIAQRFDRSTEHLYHGLKEGLRFGI
jgi:hypothetical protein